MTINSETKIYFLNEMNFQPCQACRHCKKEKNQACKLDDDMQELYNEIYNSSAVVLSTPLYMMQMAAQTKKFIDRLYAFLTPTFTSKIKKKPLILIWTQGQASPDMFSDYIKNSKKVFKLVGFKIKSVFVVPGLNRRDDINKKPELLEEVKNAVIESISA